MRFLSFLGFGGGYDKGAVLFRGYDITVAVRATWPNAAFDIDDDNYIGLQPDKLRAFLNATIDLSFCRYHSNSDEFPDCDDFSRIAQAEVRKAAIKGGMKYCPAFFEVGVTLAGGKGRHAPNLCLDANGKLWLFEPQWWAGSNAMGDDFSAIASIDEVEG